MRVTKVEISGANGNVNISQYETGYVPPDGLFTRSTMIFPTGRFSDQEAIGLMTKVYKRAQQVLENVRKGVYKTSRHRSGDVFHTERGFFVAQATAAGDVYVTYSAVSHILPERAEWIATMGLTD